MPDNTTGGSGNTGKTTGASVRSVNRNAADKATGKAAGRTRAGQIRNVGSNVSRNLSQAATSATDKTSSGVDKVKNVAGHTREAGAQAASTVGADRLVGASRSDKTVGGDISDAAQTTKQGAKLGSKIGGPAGTAIGAGVGAAAGLAKNKKALAVLVAVAVLPLLLPLMLSAMLADTATLAASRHDDQSRHAAGQSSIKSGKVSAYREAAGDRGVAWQLLAAIEYARSDGSDGSGASSKQSLGKPSGPYGLIVAKANQHADTKLSASDALDRETAGAEIARQFRTRLTRSDPNVDPDKPAAGAVTVTDKHGGRHQTIPSRKTDLGGHAKAADTKKAFTTAIKQLPIGDAGDGDAIFTNARKLALGQKLDRPTGSQDAAPDDSGGSGGSGELDASGIPAKFKPWLKKAAKTCSAASAPMLAAQEDQESGFKKKAVSSAGAVGYAQFLPETFKKVGVDGNHNGTKSATEVGDAVMSQAKYDCQLAKKVKHVPGDTTKNMLAAYNAGAGAVTSANGIPPFDETQKYVDIITHKTKKYTKKGTSSDGTSSAGKIKGKPLAKKILKTLKKKLGTPYSFGGGTATKPTVGKTEPAGWDCSSYLMMGIYQATDSKIRIARITTAQMHDKHLKKVSKKHMQPGDLIFINNDGNWGHVVMYYGHGKIIEEPHTGAKSRIRPAKNYAKDPQSIRRLKAVDKDKT